MMLEIERVGTFRVKYTDKNVNQCGKRGVTLDLRYRVEIAGDDTVLDKQGFIIDNNDIDNYFQLTYAFTGVRNFESCETIAMNACMAFRAMLMHRKGIKKICVTISGSDVAQLRATWERKSRRV